MRSDFQVEDEFPEDSEWEIDEEDPEIDGDCNESQPCRGDEPWLDQELLTLRGAWLENCYFRFRRKSEMEHECTLLKPKRISKSEIEGFPNRRAPSGILVPA